MFIAGAAIAAFGLLGLLLSPRIARSYSGNKAILRISSQFGAAILVVVGTLWMAGIGTK
jgi:Flp pilus assembly protein TadB